MADCLKLTSYLGERHRTKGTFVADALIELYGRHEIAASILLRGAEGFGLKHHLRTDRSLTLLEDLPLIAVAVDTRARIEAVLAQTIKLNRTGLVTLERARLLTDVTGPAWQPEDTDEATKLTVYLGRQERIGRVPAFMAVCDLLYRHGIDGATALLGVDGTAYGRRERAAFFSRNAEVPMMVIAVGSGTRISGILPELGALLQRPLLTMERVRICKRDGRLWPPRRPCLAPMSMAWPCGTSSWSIPPKRSSTTASRSTGPSSAGCARPDSAARPPRAASGASTASTRHMATASCSWAAMFPRSRSLSTPPNASPRRSLSSTSSPANAGSSPVRPFPPCGPAPGSVTAVGRVSPPTIFATAADIARPATS